MSVKLLGMRGVGLGAGLGAAFAAALLETVAVAVHLQDVDMMGDAIEQAPVRRSESRTSVHSWKGRLLVTMVEPRS